ncbi:MAG: DUF222 domain-containing protein [Nocardioides sp.]
MTAPLAPGSDRPATLADVVDRAERVLAELDDVLLAARSPEELLEANRRLEHHRSHLAAVQARLVVEIDDTRAAERSDQWASTAQHLTAVAAGRTGCGKRLLTTGRALVGELHLTWDALRAGVISPEQAEVVARAMRLVPARTDLRDACEKFLLDTAQVCNASELQRASERMLERVDPDGTAARDERALDKLDRSAHLNRSLSITDDGLGGVRLRGRGTVEDAAVLKAALAALAAPLPSTDPDCGLEGRDPRDHGARTWDALVEIAQRSLDTDLLPTAHGAKPRVTVMIDYDALRSGLGAALLDTGDRISAAAVRRIACDADVLPAVLGRRGELLDVGRAKRLVDGPIWRALVVRDRHCTFPGCDRPPVACDAHHIEHWADGGATSLDNLALLCRAHHTVIHQTGWEIRLSPVDRRPEFRPPPGRHRLSPEFAARLTDNDGWVRERHPRARA